MKKILMTGAVLSFILTGCSLGDLRKDSVSAGKKLSVAQAKEVSTKFINENLMQPGSEAVIETPVVENGLYKVKVSLPGGRSVDAYMTMDGSQFFPQAIDMAKFASETAAKANPEGDKATNDKAPATKINKSDKPKVEAFVMSHCPYGTQIEKGLLPAVKTLGSKVDFKIKFVDYAMHGKKELDEQTAQYCIQEQQSVKFYTYLTCFLKAGESASCLKEAKIDEAKLKKCVADTDKKFNITKNFDDKSTYKGQFPPFYTHKVENEKYGVQGSPTLVINGVQSEAGRDSASLLKAICDATNKPGKECEAKLSSASPAPGFGEGTDTSGGSADAGCATN